MLVTTLTAVILSLSAYSTAKFLLEQRVLSQLSSLVSAKEELISRRIDADRERTAIMSTRERVISMLNRSAGSADLKLLLESIQEQGVPVLGITVFAKQGATISQTGIPISPPETFPSATTLVTRSGNEGWDGYTIYSPIDGRGVLAMQYSLREFLQSIFAVPSLGKTGEVLLARKQGEELILLNHAYAEGKRSPLTMGNHTNHLSYGLPIARAVEGHEDVRRDSDYAGRDVFTAFRQIPALGWGLAVHVGRDEALKGISHMASALAMKSTFLLLIAAYLAVVLARYLTKPLRRLTEKMKHLGPGNWSLGAVAKTGDEVQLLNEIAASMGKRLKTIYDHLEEEIDARTEQLKKEYVKTNSILETIDQGVITVNKDGIITDANPAALNMLQCTAKECTGGVVDDVLDIRRKKKRLTGALHPVRIALKKKTTVRSGPEHRYSIMSNDNILVPVLLVIKPLTEGKKQIGAIVVFQDVTEERRVDYLKSEFISLASHQLRTPLSSLQWYIELITEGKTLDGEQKEYIKEMQIAAKRMTDLIDSLLHAARLEGGDITPHQNTVVINTLIVDLGAELRTMAKEKKISTTMNIPKEKVTIKTDSVLLHVVFKNLFSNAVKYTNQGGKVAVDMEVKPKYVDITVRDNGIGIPEKSKKRLFQRLFRAENVRKLDTDGNGLGLYITKMIVDNLGGSIKVESTENKGSAFTVRLPITKKKKGKKKV